MDEDEELRCASPPPPRRLSRSSIDLRDLELQHEKISHTDSAPSIVGVDRYLKSSDSEPLQFQQQLRQQLKFQEQIQQQYYLGTSGDSKGKQLRQNSLKRLNHFLQPIFCPAKSGISDKRDTPEEGGTENAETNSNEETKRLSYEDEIVEDTLQSPKRKDFYRNFYNARIALGPVRDQYVKIPNYGGVALSESDFLAIKDIEHGQRLGDNHRHDMVDERESRANNSFSPVTYTSGIVRRRSSSCEDIPFGKRFLSDTEKNAKFSSTGKEKEGEKETSPTLWKNFANKSRFGSTLKKFNSSSRLLVGSLFGDRSASAKYRNFRRNRSAMWSMDDTTMDRRDGCVGVGDSVDCGGVLECANQLTIKRSDEQLLSLEADLIRIEECKTTTKGTPEQQQQVVNEEVLVAVEGDTKESLLVVQKKQQRMRVFSDGNFDEKGNQRQKRKRMLSEGHESYSGKGLVLGHNKRATEGEGSCVPPTTISTNDTPDILMGLVREKKGTQQAEEEGGTLISLNYGEEKAQLVDQSGAVEKTDTADEKRGLEKVLLMDMSEDEGFMEAPKTRTESREEKGLGGGDLSLVDHQLLRAISNVTPVGNTQPQKPMGRGLLLTTRPEIVLDSTMGEQEESVGNGKVHKTDESEGVFGGGEGLANSLLGSNKSPSALLRRDANGMRLRQASVVTYDVNVINFGETDECSASDNYNGHVNGSFSSAAGQSNLHNGRPSTSSASECLFESPQ